MPDLFDTLKERKLVQWTVAYLAGAWALLQVAELFADVFAWPAWALRALIVVLGVGFVAAAVIAWYHGEKGRQRVGGVELLMLATLFVIAGVAVQLVRSGTPAAAGAEGDGAVAAGATGATRPVQPRSMRQLTAAPGLETSPTWSPDGRHIAFVSSRGRSPTLDQSVEFGYSLGGGIWIIPAVGGAAEPVLPDAYNPAFSPDGRQLAFDASLDGPRRIWVANADGSSPLRISQDASGAAVHTDPAWSPDGRWVAFQHLGGASSNVAASDIALVPAAGGTSRFVTRGEARDFAPAWLDAGTLLFASDRGGSIALWSVSIDGDGAPTGEPVAVTAGTAAEVEPAASTEGAIAFASVRLVNNLWRLPLDPASGSRAGEPSVVSEVTWNDIAPSPSPDGSAIVFASDRAGEVHDLWISAVDGSGLRRLTFGGGRDLEPVWSRDGNRIAYYSDRDGDNEIYVVRPEGGEPVGLTDDPADDINPYWSPDGRAIAFMSDRSGQHEVWVMQADGAQPRRLTDIGATGHTALWSPDGEWILFTSQAEGDRDIWAVPSAGGEPRRVTTGPSQDAHGLWSPDGRHVYYLRDHRTLVRVPFDGGAEEDVYTPGVRIDYAELSRDGRVLVYTLARSEGDVWIAR